jgi:ribulose 1,5-bisphosphate synthetase/thiazole synthase
MNTLGKACRTVLKERLQSAFRRSASQTPIEKAEWDAIIVGGGHNGLVAAAYLAKKASIVISLKINLTHFGFREPRCWY